MNKNREGIVWGLMTDAEKSELQFVERDGKSVEEYDGTSWRKMTDGRFLRYKAYRVVPSRQGKCESCKNNDDKPELMICQTATRGSHAKPHKKNEVCGMGLNKCVPYVPTEKTCENCKYGENPSDCNTCQQCWYNNTHPNWQRKTEKAVELPEVINIMKFETAELQGLALCLNELIKYLKAKDLKGEKWT